MSGRAYLGGMKIVTSANPLRLAGMGVIVAAALASAVLLAIPAAAPAIPGCPTSTFYDEPTAAFNWTAQPAQAIAFDASGSAPGVRTVLSGGTPPDCFDQDESMSPMPITSYSWDFGDGTPAGTGVSPTHTFASAGDYVVTLTAATSAPNHATDGAQQTVTVVATPPPTPPSAAVPAPTVATPKKCKKGRKLKRGKCVKKKR